jgi:hypothetical protein
MLSLCKCNSQRNLDWNLPCQPVKCERASAAYCFVSPWSVKEQVLLIALIMWKIQIVKLSFTFCIFYGLLTAFFNVCSTEWSVFIVHFLLYKLISCLADQWISQFFWQTNIHYYVYNNLPLINCPKTLDSNSHALILFHLGSFCCHHTHN